MLRVSALVALCLGLAPAPALAGFLEIAPAVSGSLMAFHSGPEDTYSLDLGGGGVVTTNRLRDMHGVLLFDLRVLDGLHVESITLTVDAVLTQANPGSSVGLDVRGFSDEDGVVELADVVPGAGLSFVGGTNSAPANESGISLPLSVDVTGFASSPSCGFRLDARNRDDFIAYRAPRLVVAYAAPEPASLGMVGAGMLWVVGLRRWLRRWGCGPAGRATPAWAPRPARARPMRSNLAAGPARPSTSGNGVVPGASARAGASSATSPASSRASACRGRRGS